MAHDVFISYATSDKPVADAVCATLEARGIRRWIAPGTCCPARTGATLSYELRCRATPYKTGKAGAAEPDRIDAEMSMVQDLLHFLLREDLLFSFCAKNAGDHFVVSKAARVK